MTTLCSRHQGLLGTDIEIQTVAEDRERAEAGQQAAINEIRRLQRVFNVYDPQSELRRNARYGDGPELTKVLDLADQWRSTSGGAFDPMSVGPLMSLWEAAAVSGTLPSQPEIDAASQSAPARATNLNAIAKGWIIDRAADLAEQAGVEDLVINAGGDIVHRGSRTLTVGIENPLRPFDNVEPQFRVSVHNRCLATSGTSHRGWTVANRRFGHVIDPRSGWPVTRIRSATVVADNAASADVLATILTVIDDAELAELADRVAPFGYLVTYAAGETRTNDPLLFRRSPVDGEA